jgi:hypothetical protein
MGNLDWGVSVGGRLPTLLLKPNCGIGNEGVSVGGRLPTLLLEPNCGIGKEGTGELGMEFIGGLVEM